jgi:peptide/nickel transport system permease protein
MTASTLSATPAAERALAAVSPRSRPRWLRNGTLLLGLALLLPLLVGALAAPWLAPHDPFEQDVVARLLKPVWQAGGSWEHVLGTDKLGRDYLSRLLHGARISMLVGFSAAALAGLIGVTMGLLAGYFGGRVDAVISWLITTRLAMPVILVALALSALMGGSPLTVIGLLGALLWDRFAIVSRALTQQLRGQDFIAAARLLGASDARILLREALPNIAGPLLVIFTLEVSHAVLLEATLSFLGLGVQPPAPSWGLMVAEAKSYLYFEPWLLVIPALAIVALVTAITLVGDGLRDLVSWDGRA